MAKLFVGNLSYDATEDDVREAFAPYEADVVGLEVLVSGRGRPKGCALVDMATEAAADEACEALTGMEILGRPIVVRYDRFAGGAPPGRANGGGAGAPAKPVDSTRLFVGNLSFDATNEDLEDLFLTVLDEVASVEVLCRNGGRSRGCAIVETISVEDAQAASEALNGSEHLGRILVVRGDRHPNGGGAAAAPIPAHMEGPDLENLTARLFVNNLPYSVAWQDLKDLFSEAGTVVFTEVLLRRDGRSKGCGIVEFEDAAAASAAIEMFQDYEVQGRRIFLREDREDRDYHGPMRRA